LSFAHSILSSTSPYFLLHLSSCSKSIPMTVTKSCPDAAANNFIRCIQSWLSSYTEVCDIIVNECPKFQCSKPTDDNHAIIVERNNGHPYHKPLSLQGTTSYIDVRLPTQAKIDDTDLDRIELTYSTPDWEPGTTRYSTMEQRLQQDCTLPSRTRDSRLGD
jgi:hypothetical protein